MEASATIRFLRVSPRKARLVADEVRGKMVGDALSVLQFGITKGVSTDILKLIKSAVANVQSRQSDTAVDPEELKVKEIRVDDGPRLGRFRARAQGRVGRITKRMCHITVTVAN
ncbi:MAG: 50S ribosomal protein L22 [Chitinivibrionales bacterium]|nr:50S ribosomal protein L22 [Chitinivibrionales bacterium]MBD3396944.1 50S ribosomal protein L22 [Chitinivibrionales bacterium]